jgi:hypothetical protein
LVLAVCGAIGLFAPSAAAQDAIADPAAGAAAESFHMEAAGAFWRPAAGFIIATDAPGIPGTRVDTTRDLGLANRRLPQIQLVIKPAKKHKIRLQYIPITYDSTATLPRDIDVNGTRYRQGEVITWSLDWQAYRVGYEYDFFVKPWGFVGVIGELKQTNFSLTVRGAAGDQSPRTTLPTPATGGIVRVYPVRRVSITGELTGVRVPGHPDQHYGGYYVELDAYGTVSLVKNAGVQFGFRSFDIDHLGARNSATLSLRGLYVGAVVRY